MLTMSSLEPFALSIMLIAMVLSKLCQLVYIEVERGSVGGRGVKFLSSIVKITFVVVLI